MSTMVSELKKKMHPEFFFQGACQGSSSQMLSGEQWKWLEEELARPAELTIIASGVQVAVVCFILVE